MTAAKRNAYTRIPVHVPSGEVYWRQRAACAGEDPELWFSTRPADQRRAQAICGACPVRAECLEWAAETGQLYGIWGGEDVSGGYCDRGHPRAGNPPGGRCAACDSENCATYRERRKRATADNSRAKVLATHAEMTALGRSEQEVAEALGLTVTSLKRALQRARKDRKRDQFTAELRDRVGGLS